MNWLVPGTWYYFNDICMWTDLCQVLGIILMTFACELTCVRYLVLFQWHSHVNWIVSGTWYYFNDIRMWTDLCQVLAIMNQGRELFKFYKCSCYMHKYNSEHMFWMKLFLWMWIVFHSCLTSPVDGLVQERHNFIANALELHLSCTNPSTCYQLSWTDLNFF